MRKKEETSANSRDRRRKHREALDLEPDVFDRLTAYAIRNEVSVTECANRILQSFLNLDALSFPAEPLPPLDWTEIARSTP